MGLLQSLGWSLQPCSTLRKNTKDTHTNITQVTLGLCRIGAVPWARGGLVFIAQMFGAMASAGVVKGLFPGPLAVTTSLSGGTGKAQGLFIEMVDNVRCASRFGLTL